MRATEMQSIIARAVRHIEEHKGEYDPSSEELRRLPELKDFLAEQGICWRQDGMTCEDRKGKHDG